MFRLINLNWHKRSIFYRKIVTSKKIRDFLLNEERSPPLNDAKTKENN